MKDRGSPETASIDVTSMGNAIVDVLWKAPEAYIGDYALNKGTMTLIDEERAEFLTGIMAEDKLMESGGSAGNSAVGLAALGARSAYVGKVKDDELGHAFRSSLTETGAHFDVPFSTEGPATARCLIFVTPDGQRTMNTFLGASTRLAPEDIDEALIASSAVTYMEGYLWDQPAAKEAFRLAADVAHQNKRLTSLSLSDPFCVDRWRAEFLDLIEQGMIDIIFANQDELKSLYQTDDLNIARDEARSSKVRLVALTKGYEGSEILVPGQEDIDVPVVEVVKRVDTTGAGDLYAAGFLYGFTKGEDLETCGLYGSRAAAAVIQRVGARLSKSELAAVTAA
ncbi:MAG: adenosine kinase [Alphaproteobacteria bacterium]